MTQRTAPAAIVRAGPAEKLPLHHPGGHPVGEIPQVARGTAEYGHHRRAHCCGDMHQARVIGQ